MLQGHRRSRNRGCRIYTGICLLCSHFQIFFFNDAIAIFFSHPASSWLSLLLYLTDPSGQEPITKLHCWCTWKSLWSTFTLRFRPPYRDASVACSSNYQHLRKTPVEVSRKHNVLVGGPSLLVTFDWAMFAMHYSLAADYYIITLLQNTYLCQLVFF